MNLGVEMFFFNSAWLCHSLFYCASVYFTFPELYFTTRPPRHIFGHIKVVLVGYVKVILLCYCWGTSLEGILGIKDSLYVRGYIIQVISWF